MPKVVTQLPSHGEPALAGGVLPVKFAGHQGVLSENRVFGEHAFRVSGRSRDCCSDFRFRPRRRLGMPREKTLDYVREGYLIAIEVDLEHLWLS